MIVSCKSVRDPDLLQSHHASWLSLIGLWILSHQGLDCSCGTVTSGLNFGMLDRVACFSIAARWLRGRSMSNSALPVTSPEKGINGQHVIPDNISVDRPVTSVPFWFVHNFSCLVNRFLGMYLEGANHRNMV